MLAALGDGLVRTKAEAAREASVSAGTIDGLLDEGTLEAIVLPREPVTLPPEPEHPGAVLTELQAAAASVLREAVRGAEFSVHLLDGVTGSGKTEVYFEAVAEVLRRGKQALILLPEIALTDALPRPLRRALRRHDRPNGIRRWRRASARAPGRRWRAARCGSWPGRARRCFCRSRQLGLIVVDEEHDPAYKQEDGVHYHARDMAVVRARLNAAPIVLASATPSLETEVNARRGRYKRLALPERFGGSSIPPLEAIDLRKSPPPRGRWISPRLEAAVSETIERGEQALLFLNRRGYAPLTLCRTCGHRMRCPNCDSWLVEHRFRSRLICHHCGFALPKPETCPKCSAADSFVACGPGVERLEEEVHALFPKARTLVLSSDLSGGVERLRAELDAVTKGEIDLVIGTQLVAKGHHFPSLALVGVIDADLGLAWGDPRAAERTFQLLHQVVGRAGRAAAAGRGLLQTHQPEHPVMAALIAGDRAAFYDREIAAREEAGLPPFGRLASLIVSAADMPSAQGHAQRLAASAPEAPEVRVLGPAEAPLAVVRKRHRFRLLLKSRRGFDLSAYIRGWLASAPKPKGSVRVVVDIDPQSFL